MRKLLSAGRKVYTQVDEDCGYLSNRAEIETKFEEFCHEHDKDWYQLATTKEINNNRRQAVKPKGSSIRLQAVASMINFNHLPRKSNLYQATKDPSKKFIAKSVTARRQSAEFFEEKVKFFVQKYFKRRVEEKQTMTQESTTKGYGNDNIHLLVRKYGDFLSKSLIDSLVVVTLKNQFGSQCPPYDHFGTAQKILNQFEISALELALKQRQNHKLNSSDKERREYIMSKFTKTIETLLKDWTYKMAQKQRKLRISDEVIAREILRTGKQNDDLFDWLHLKTKYDVLQSKLRVMIMEQINEYENSLRIIDALKKREAGTFTNQDQIELVGVKKLNTREIVSRTDPKVDKLMKSLKGGHNLVEQDTVLEPAYIVEGFQWNEELECKFLKERKTAKARYFTSIASCNFNQMACMPLFEDVSPDDPKHLQRDIKLAKYQDGEWMTPLELKFLANTSQLLNSCVDQQLIKQALKVVKPSEIDHLETNLAEQIIQNYEQMKTKILSSRNEFIKNKIEQQKLGIQERDRQLTKQNLQKQNKSQNARLLKRLQVVCKKMKQDLTIKDQVYQNIYAQMFVKVIQKKVKEIRQRKEKLDDSWDKEYKEKKQQERIRKEKLKEMSKPFKDQSVQDKRRRYHPASKLSFYGRTLQTQQSEEQDGPEYQHFIRRKRLMDQKVKEYKVGVLEVAKNEKKDFIKFYSSGPSKALRQEPLFNEFDPEAPIVVSPKELAAITLIQKSVKRYLQQRNLKNYKDVYYQKKFKQYYQRLEDKFFGNKFMSVVRQVNLKHAPAIQEDTGTVLKANESDTQLQTAISESRTEPTFSKVQNKSLAGSPQSFQQMNRINQTALSLSQSPKISIAPNSKGRSFKPAFDKNGEWNSVRIKTQGDSPSTRK